MTNITAVAVRPGCIGCGTCAGICPAIFRVKGTSAVIGRDFVSHAEAIAKAAKSCPVGVIAVVADGATASSVTPILNGTLAAVQKLTADVFAFFIACKDFTFAPGQFVAVRMRDAAGEFTRCYSVAGYQDNRIELIIKLVSSGRGAAWWRALGQNAAINFAPAAGHFVLQNTPAPKLLVATGTGLAPILAMAAHLSAQQSHTEITILTGVRSETDVFYAERLAALPGVRLIYTVSQPGPVWAGARGRVTDYLKSFLTPRAEIYICGNPEMVQSVTSAAHAAGHPPTQIFTEEFAPAPAEPSAQTRRLNPIRFCNWILMALAAAVPLAWLLPAARFPLWDMSFFAAALLLLIRPLGDLLPGVPLLRRLLVLRQGLGILSASVVATNAAFNYLPQLANFPALYFNSAYWRLADFSFFAHGSELAGIVLLATSNRASQIALGHCWKHLQRFAYFYFYAAGIYLLHLGKTFDLYPLLFVATVQLLALFKKNATSAVATITAVLLAAFSWLQLAFQNPVVFAKKIAITTQAQALEKADTTPPTIAFVWPTDGLQIATATTDVTLALADDSGHAWARLQVLDAAGAVVREYTADQTGVVRDVALPTGVFSLLAIANDNAKNVVTAFVVLSR